MKTLELNGHVYNIGTMTVFDQLQVARRIMPMSAILEAMTNDRNAGKDLTVLLMMVLGNLSDENHVYVVTKCLSQVSKLEGDKPAKITTPTGELMYAHIDLQTTVDLVTAVILENLGGFFHTALSRVAEGAVKL